MKDESNKPRYAANSFAWWLHDVIIHPLTGHMGLLGRLLKSPRLMALSHHIHNATAPSNDAWGDWADAAYRDHKAKKSTHETSPDAWESWANGAHRAATNENGGEVLNFGYWDVFVPIQSGRVVRIHGRPGDAFRVALAALKEDPKTGIAMERWVSDDDEKVYFHSWPDNPYAHLFKKESK